MTLNSTKLEALSPILNADPWAVSPRSRNVGICIVLIEG